MKMNHNIKRVWINQPSTFQHYHKWHGKRGIADMGEKSDAYAIIYFTEGSVLSMEIAKNALSDIGA